MSIDTRLVPGASAHPAFTPLPETLTTDAPAARCRNGVGQQLTPLVRCKGGNIPLPRHRVMSGRLRQLVAGTTGGPKHRDCAGCRSPIRERVTPSGEVSRAFLMAREGSSAA